MPIHPCRCLIISGNLLLGALLITPAGAVSQAAGADVTGTWEGTLDAGTAQLRLVVHVTRADDGALTGTLDSPDQGATAIPLTAVEGGEGRLAFSVQSLGVSFEGTLGTDGGVTGTFTQGPVSLPLTLRQVDRPTEPSRPQLPREPFPYRTEDVSIETPSPGVVLAGTFTFPAGEGPFPAVVLVSGSGPQDRDETIMGHKPFLVLADHLTRAGIAVLRYDDRGVGGSTGSFAAATSEDFSVDAVAAVQWLARRNDIAVVGIVGHSEGGLIGPMAAARSDDIGFLVLLAGPGIPGAQILDLQAAMINRVAGAPEEVIRRNRELQQELFAILRSEPDTAAASARLRAALERAASTLPDGSIQRGRIDAELIQLNSPWFRFFLDYDPRPALEQVRVPVLALNGGKDLQVPPNANLPEVRAALERGGNPDVTTRVLPGLNHLFQTAATGGPEEYARIPETLSPLALDAVRDWILERFGPTG
jgi:pimeloyl-ACP methyl ester carboxylesterase